MSNVKKVTIEKLIDGSINLIYPRTSADMVVYDESISIKDKIDNITNEVISNTKQYWNSDITLISKKDTIYVYTDYKRLANGSYIPGIKIGDGLAYLIDLPFIDVEFREHIDDQSIHVSQADRNNWNNKVSLSIDISDPENLKFEN